MPLALAPEIIATIAKFNPVEWAVAGGREAMSASPDWAIVGVRVGLLGRPGSGLLVGRNARVRDVSAVDLGLALLRLRGAADCVCHHP